MRRLVQRLVLILLVALVVFGLPGYFERPEPAVPTPPPDPTFANVDIRLTKISDLQSPTAMAVRRRDPALYIATKDGRVHALRNGRSQVVLDVSDEVHDEHERGLLGLTFSPGGNLIIVDFVDRQGDTHVRAFRFRGGRAVVDSGRDVLFIDHPDTIFHNAGQLAFGPDGYLYLSHGDGGFPGDPEGFAQAHDNLFGKIMRIEILPGLATAIPKDNPFVGREGARPEIWAYGLRNPWRFSFDALTGDLWIADVGRAAREEINFESGGSPGGRNYGWNYMEGTKAFVGDPPEGHVLPIYDYSRRIIEGNLLTCAVIGGYVYRGSKMPGLRGAYLFSDHCRGRVEAIRQRDGRVTRHRALSAKVVQVTGFGQDRAGELYIMSLTQGVYRIDPA
jgi:glucose/arabinose dehydrogenase